MVETYKYQRSNRALQIEQLPGTGRLEQDYDTAVIRLAVLHKKPNDGEQQFHLLFAMVELLTPDIPAPANSPVEKPNRSPIRVWSKRLSNRGNEINTIFIDHVVVDVATALEWYRRCREDGMLHLPDDDKFDFDGNGGHELGAFTQEPVWPELTVLPAGNPHELPFVQGWHVSPRVHNLLRPLDVTKSAPFIDRLLKDEDERNTATDFVSEHFHFDWSEWPELCGSAHLVLANPVLRGCGMTLQDKPNEFVDTRGINFKVSPRDATSLETLTLHVWEKRENGAGFFKTVDLNDGVVHLQREGGESLIGFFVTCSERGLVAYSGEPTSFMKKIVIQQRMVGSTQIISGSVEGRRPIEYKRQVGLSQDIEVGESEVEFDGERVLRQGRYRRDGSEASLRTKQRWFSGQLDRAERFVRAIVWQQTESVRFVDPYFGASALLRFGVGTSSADTKVQVLTSTHFLVQTREGEDGDASKQTRGHQLQYMIEQVLEKGLVKRLEVRVMPSRAMPEIHDRFLMLDNDAWLIGCSFEDFGKRGSMAVRLHSADHAREQIQDVWDRAKPLREWLTERNNEEV